ncbi:MAG: chromate efflux transporter [Pseudomonadota bacterium]|nr:chromate efflux transporter [Pseudomonadota bacterium]
MNQDGTPTGTAAGPSASPRALADIFSGFAKIGLLSFGGPAAQIAVMHRVLVEENNWLSERQFLNALNFCMLLPGPEAMQLTTYAGWRLRGVPGGLMAGLLFVVPGAAVMLALAAIYGFFGAVPLVSALFLGIKAAVLVVVIEALLKVARRALTAAVYWLIAGLAFVAIFFFAVPFPLVVLAAAAYGFLRGGDTAVEAAATAPISPLSTLRTVVLWGVIWWLPVIIVDQALGLTLLTEIGVFFSKLAVVTFGGAYAVLTYMAQEVVSDFGWLDAGEMMDGLGLAETTPGPLILVTQFVGFLAGFKNGGLGVAVIAAVLTLWVTFAPCFLWIFAGAPYIERIAAQPRLSGALTAITAAVVGVILNLSLWFALHVAFGSVAARDFGPLTLWWPDWATVDWRVIGLALAAAVLLLKLRWGVPTVLALAAAAGLVLSYLA